MAARHASPFERLADEARAFEAVAPRMIHRLAEPDARADGDVDVLRPRAELEWRRIERKPVLRAGDAERLAQPSGPSTTGARPRRRGGGASRGGPAWARARGSAPRWRCPAARTRS